jgi:hypothetical protein
LEEHKVEEQPSRRGLAVGRLRKPFDEVKRQEPIVVGKRAQPATRPEPDQILAFEPIPACRGADQNIADEKSAHDEEELHSVASEKVEGAKRVAEEHHQNGRGAQHIQSKVPLTVEWPAVKLPAVRLLLDGDAHNTSAYAKDTAGRQAGT